MKCEGYNNNKKDNENTLMNYEHFLNSIMDKYGCKIFLHNKKLKMASLIFYKNLSLKKN